MSGSTTTVSSSINVNTTAFWERLWRTSGIQFVGLCVVAYLFYGSYPRIAAVVGGLAVLYLMWFAAAIRVALADAGEDGWGAAATASSAAVGAVLLLLVAVDAAHVPGLTAIAWAGFVMSSFVRAMLIMSAAFGFWRAGLISNGLFAVGVAAVVLTVLGGTTWGNGGFWAPDGAYSSVISPIIGMLWALVISWVLLKRSPAARSGW